jgi:hypothetical protein
LVTLEQIRAWAMALPEVEEGPPVRAARRIAAFKVAGKSFVGVETGGTAMTVSLSEPEAEELLVDRPDVFAAVRRNGMLLGVRVDLGRIGEAEVRQLIEHSWVHSAPRRLAPR